MERRLMERLARIKERVEKVGWLVAERRWRRIKMRE